MKYPHDYDVPVGEYQAVFEGTFDVQRRPGLPAEVALLFTITETNDKKNPQYGLGGRAARMWLSLNDDNPATAADAQ